MKKQRNKYIKKLDELLGYKTKDKWREILEAGDRICETRERKRVKEISTIMAIYQGFLQQIHLPRKFKKMADELRRHFREELENTLNPEQREVLDKWEEVEDMIIEDKVQESYVEGFILGSSLNNEALRMFRKKYNKM